MREIYEILVGKSEREMSHGRPRCRWEDNIYLINMNLKEMGSEILKWVHLSPVKL
jgi:hypothetical protein